MTTPNVESTGIRVLGERIAEPGQELDTFPNPGVDEVTLESTEFTSLCPVTGQPDFGTVTIKYEPKALCLESKSLKLFLWGYRERGAFCESLVAELFERIWVALDPSSLDVTIKQNPRGGISIVATRYDISETYVPPTQTTAEDTECQSDTPTVSIRSFRRTSPV